MRSKGLSDIMIDFTEHPIDRKQLMEGFEYSTHVNVEVISKQGKGFGGYRELRVKKLNDVGLEWARQKTLKQILELADYGGRSEIQARANHPLAPLITQLSMGTHEAARDRRIEGAQAEAGYNFENFRSLPRLPGSVEALLEIRVHQRMLDLCDLNITMPVELDRVMVQHIRDEQASRASSFSFEEEMVRKFFPDVINYIKDSTDLFAECSSCGSVVRAEEQFSCSICKTFICNRCVKVVSWDRGAADEMSGLCDACWCKVKNSR